MSQIYQPRRDTAANWTSANPTLPSGVLGVETDTGLAKFGDGATAWATLPYIGGASYVPGMATVETEVLAIDTTTVTITLPAGYLGFRIEAKLRGAVAATTAGLRLRLNGDAGSVYQSQYVRATSTTASAAEQAAAATVANIGQLPGSTATAGYYAHVVIDIPFPDMTTGWKDVLVRSGFAYGTAAGEIVEEFNWAIRRNTEALTSCSLFAASGDILAGSTFKTTRFG